MELFFLSKSWRMANYHYLNCFRTWNDSSAGNVYSTIMPADEYYEQEYGWVGKLYYQLGFNNLYGSWWYLLLIAMIGISLVICSLDRVVPLYKALKAQRVTRHEGFLKRQRIFGVNENADENDFMKIKNI